MAWLLYLGELLLLYRRGHNQFRDIVFIVYLHCERMITIVYNDLRFLVWTMQSFFPPLETFLLKCSYCVLIEIIKLSHKIKLFKIVAIFVRCWLGVWRHFTCLLLGYVFLRCSSLRGGSLLHFIIAHLPGKKIQITRKGDSGWDPERQTCEHHIQTQLVVKYRLEQKVRESSSINSLVS